MIDIDNVVKVKALDALNVLRDYIESQHQEDLDYDWQLMQVDAAINAVCRLGESRDEV